MKRWWMFLILMPVVFANTYYVCDNSSDCGTEWSTGSDTNDCGAKSLPCKTISAGISKISGGDELVIGDGIYEGNQNIISDVPSGTSSTYTTVRAENDWGVTISDTTSTPAVIGTRNDPYPSYVILRGIHFRNHLGNKVVVEGDYVKVIRCSSDGAGGSAASFMASGNYILFEECHSYGGPNRYTFRTYGGFGKGEYIIFRRCVCRWDYSNTNEPQACFANYDTPHAYYQNCIAIDGKDIRGIDFNYGGLKGFFTPNGARETHIEGSISLNLEGAGYWIEDSPVEDVSIKNSIAWDSNEDYYPPSYNQGYGAHLLYTRSGNGPLNIDHSTFGDGEFGGVNGRPMTNDYFTNNIVMDVSSGYALGQSYDLEDYNVFYDNLGSGDTTATPGSNDYCLANGNAIDPFTDSLFYLPRIEDDSPLDGTASDGGDRGATILKRIGVSGTLYGEEGWNEETEEDLWPWPNENVIKQDAGSFYKASDEAFTDSPEMIGARGFAAAGNGLYGGPITLTSYIWEYLGNPCPDDICDYLSQPVCGDESCNGDEDCNNCALDCGNCSIDCVHDADNNPCDNQISLTELISYITQWKYGGATIQNLMQVIVIWKG